MNEEIIDVEQEIIWKPNEGSQVLFLNCPYREVMFEGSRGGGKTDCVLMAFAQNVGRGYGKYWRGVIFRRSYKELDDIVSKSERWFSQVFPDARFLRAKGEYKWVFPDGEELNFRHFEKKEDYWNYHGQEFPFIAWEELTTWPSNECYETMFSCNRTSYSPDKVDRAVCASCHGEKVKGRPCGSCGWEPPARMIPQVRSTTNPYGVGHSWVKAYFVDPSPAGVPIKTSKRVRVRISSSMFENKHLNDEYIDDIRSLSDANLRKAWLYGSWDIVAGGMFSHVWDNAKHIVNEFDIPSTWKIDRGFDWGSSKPYCCLWYAESDGSDYEDHEGNEIPTIKGDIFVMYEEYGWNGTPNEGLRLTNKEIAKRIRDIEKENPMFKDRRVIPGPADSAIFTVENGRSIADDMKIMGIRWRRADKSPGSRKAGWQVIIQKLKNAVTKEGEGLYFFESCMHSRRLIPVTPRDSKDMDDIDTDFEDHLQDTLRYRCRKKSSKTKVRNMR